MSREYFHDICEKAMGEAVELETSDGALLQGVIVRLDHNYVYVNPLKDLMKDWSLHAVLNPSTDDVFVIPLASILSLSFISVYW
ncbi:MAG: hypothetical protein ACO1OC_10315 [Tuberibacillus sp.]